MNKNISTGIPFYILSALTYLAMILTLFLIFMWSPIEKVMGPVQKIFYFHVGIAWVGFFAFLIVALCSFAYLLTKEIKWDIIAKSSASIGLLFMTLVLITGVLWGRSSWNTWWVWEPRLATSLLLWLMYCVYFFVRELEMEKGKKLFSVSIMGIIGFLIVLSVIFSIKFLRINHPMLIEQGKMSISPAMLKTMIISVITFTLYYLHLLQRSMQIFTTENEINKLKK